MLTPQEWAAIKRMADRPEHSTTDVGHWVVKLMAEVDQRNARVMELELELAAAKATIAQLAPTVAEEHPPETFPEVHE